MDNRLWKMDSGAVLGAVHEGQHLRKPAGSGMRRMRTFGLFAVVYVYHGGGTYHDARGTSAEVEPGDLIVVFPELPHRYGAGPRRPWHEFYVVFDGPLFESWRAAGLLDPARPIWKLRPIRAWRDRFERIVEPGPPWLAVARLQHVLAEALAAQRFATPGQDDDWLRRACALLERDLERPLAMPDVARALGVSYDLFRKRFTRAAGETPAQHRARRVIARAQSLMATSTMSDQQIAAALGFCDPFYFSRRFRQMTGQSPTAYRNTLTRDDSVRTG